MSGQVTWQAEGHPLRVSYSEELMDTILQAAIGGLRKIPRRGLEIGGVLWGRRDGDELELVEWQPIHCDHASGPGFILSEPDEQALRRQLEDVPVGTDGEPLTLIGWFRTRTLGEVILVRADADLHDRMFPQPWQIILVMRPYENQPSRAGFFFRSAGGVTPTGSSPKEFNIGRGSRRLPIGFDPANPPVPPGEELPPPPRPPAEPRARRPREARIPRPAPLPVSPAAIEVEEEVPFLSGRRMKALRVAAAILAALLIVILIPLFDGGVEQALSPRVQDVDGQLVLVWNRQSTPALVATSGELRITDGSEQRVITLAEGEIRSGSVTYQRNGADVRFDLRLNLPNGEVVSEITNYVGREPAASAPVTAAAVEESDSLSEEMENMREDLAREQERADILRKAIEAEKTRLGITNRD